MKSSLPQPTTTIDEEIQQLIKAFERTQITQNEIIRKLKEKVKYKDQARTLNSRGMVDTGEAALQGAQVGNKIILNVKELNYTKDFPPKVGDEVRILNPRENQPNRGIIQGFCRDKKARVKVKGHHKPIDRAWKNIVCTYRQSEQLQNDGKRSSKRRH